MRLASFTGLWQLERRIDDRRAARAGRLTGTARVTPASGGLAYLEQGVLTLDGAAPMTAARALLWREAEGRIEVRFDDGRFFHSFPADAPEPVAEHPCGPDLYRVRYDFRAWPRWRSEWRAQGTHKDYRLVSVYDPAPAD